jgi:hypothetical protein
MDTEPTVQGSTPPVKPTINSSDKKTGCFVISLIFVVFIIFAVLVYFGWRYFKNKPDTVQTNEQTATENQKKIPLTEDKQKKDSSPSKNIEGKILASTETLNNNNEVLLWVISEGTVSGKTVDKSFNTLTIYDPLKKEAVRQITGKFNATGTSYRFYPHKDKVWFLSEKNQSNNAEDNLINAYNSQNGDELLNTNSFIEKYEELSPGVNSMSLDNQFAALKITAKDGKKYVYNVNDEKLVSEKDWNKAKYSGTNEVKIPYYSLIPEPYAEGRMLLYKLLIPKSRVPDRGFRSQYFSDVFIINFFRDNQKEVTPGKVYFRGSLYYFDDEIIVIMSNKDLDQKSEIKMLCLNTKGEELWSKTNSEIYTASITYYNIVSRAGNSLVVKIKDKGIKAFDYKTGEGLWSFDF